MKTIVTMENKRRKFINATRVKDYPGLIAHPTLAEEEAGWWTVTHEATGRMVAYEIPSLKRAKQLIKEVHSLVNWESDDVNLIRNLPAAVKKILITAIHNHSVYNKEIWV